jgi:hypothetical protein
MPSPRRAVPGLALVAACLLGTTGAGADDDARPHPHPRIIITVDRVRGPHDRDQLQAAARGAWSRVVACYREAMGRGVLARGTVHVQLEVSGEGAVKRARRQRATVDEQLAACLVGTMRGLAMPEARSGSTADVTIRVAPGD